MDKPGKRQGPNNESSRTKSQSHPQGERHEGPRLSRSETHSNPKSRAGEVLQQVADGEANSTTASKDATTAKRQAAHGDDDLMSQDSTAS